MGAIAANSGVGAFAQAIATNPLVVAAASSAAPAIAKATPPSGPGWTIFDETNATPAIIDAINGAKRVINAEFFTITDAGKGEGVTDALEAAARRGVEVNVITDLTAAVTFPLLSFARFKRRIEAAGGHVKVTTHGLPGGGAGKAALRHVDHRKVVTVDGEIAFTGGINYAKVEDAYHDSMIRLTGVNAARLSADQLDRWSRVNGGKVSDVHTASVAGALKGASLVSSNPKDLQVIANAPEQERFELSDEYLRLIQTATKRLWIATPQYLDQKLIEEINKAAQRGVDVRIIAPGKAPLGILPLNWIGHSHYKELIGYGGTVYEIPEVLHRKAIIADDTAVLASYNITQRSRLHDHEVGIKSSDPTYVAAIESTLQRDSDRGTKLEAAKLTGFGQWVGDLLAQRLKFNY